MKVSQAIMAAQGVTVDHVRAADYVLAPGVQPDMTEHGFEKDDWPGIFARVARADILVIGTPIWLGERSSICSSVIERLYAQSAQLNDKGQFVYYGKVGGCIVTGNEDGIKHVAMGVLYALQHLGYTIPPQADAGWIGEAGPGPSYGDTRDDGSFVGFDNEFTQRNTTFMTWNLLHLARLLKDAGGIPAHGNQQAAWEAGNRFDHPHSGHA
jgi:multimeric flavodoxin WrbA